MDPPSCLTLDPEWVAVGILMHRFELSRLEAVAALHVMAEMGDRDTTAQAQLVMDSVSDD